MAATYSTAQEFAAQRTGVRIVLATAILLAFLHGDISISHAVMARPGRTFLELSVALTGGAAGACAILLPRLRAAFFGVAIATTLAFPLICCAVFLARGESEFVGRVFLLAIVSIGAVYSAASFVMWTGGVGGDKCGKLQGSNFIRLGILLLLTGLLFANLRGLVGDTPFEASVRRDVKQGAVTSLVDLRVAQQERSARPFGSRCRSCD